MSTISRNARHFSSQNLYAGGVSETGASEYVGPCSIWLKATRGTGEWFADVLDILNSGEGDCPDSPNPASVIFGEVESAGDAGPP